MTEKVYHIGLPKQVLDNIGVKPGHKITVKRTIEDVYILEEQNDPDMRDESED